MAQRFKSKVKGTPEYKRRQRRIAVRKAADPLAPELNAAANLRYGEQERGLRSELRGSDSASARIPSYFAQYQGELQRLRGAQQAGYQAAQADIQRTSAGSAAMAQQGNQQVQQQAQQQANVTGGQVDVNAIPRAAQSIATRQDAANTFSGGLRARQAESNTFSLSREAVAEGEKINQLLEERKRRRQTEGKVTDLAKEKGDFKVAKREDIIGARHKRILERKAFNLDVSEAEQKSLEAAERFNVQERGQNKTRQTAKDRLAFDKDKEAWDRAHPNAGKGGAGGRTPTQIRADKKNLNKARADVRATIGAYPNMKSRTPRGQKLRSQAINSLMRKYGYSHKQAQGIVRKQTGVKPIKTPKYGPSRERVKAERRTGG